jgi:hypothetical protein
MEKIVAFLMCVDAHFVLFCGPRLFEKMGFHLSSIKSIPAALSLLRKAGFSRRFHKVSKTRHA